MVFWAHNPLRHLSFGWFMTPPHLLKSVAERARRLNMEKLGRTRRDDRMVEVFLAWWDNGAYASNPAWLPQHTRNVEVVASNAAGSKIAIEHTTIHAFEDHQEYERWLAEIAAPIESDPNLVLPGRRVTLIF